MQPGSLKIAAVALVAALVGGTTVAWASHQFDDVPDAGFHDQIGEIVDAGCAVGFDDGTFRPRANTTRGQFSYWMNNCGGRRAFNTEIADFVPGAEFDFVPGLAPVTVTSGAQGAGAGFVVVIATGTTEASADGSLEWRLLRDVGGGADILDDALDSITTPAGATVQSSSSVTLMATEILSAGEDATYVVDVVRKDGIPLAGLDIEVVAMYFPFDGNGEAAEVPH